jgi:hypothetical protein
MILFDQIIEGWYRFGDIEVVGSVTEKRYMIPIRMLNYINKASKDHSTGDS